MLAWTIYVTFAGVVATLLLPARIARTIALLTSLAGLGLAIAGFIQFDPKAGLLEVTKTAWIPSLGAQYFLAADGITITLVLLTGLAAVAGVLFSWNIEHRAKEYFAF